MTGVQTCALPIYLSDEIVGAYEKLSEEFNEYVGVAVRSSATAEDLRSEERRVGKECRSRWSPSH